MKTPQFNTDHLPVPGNGNPWFILHIIGVILVLAAWTGPGVRAETQTIRVGFYDNPPKIFMDAQGRPTGFWPDLVRYIAGAQGWEVLYVPGTWDQGLERLADGRIDMMPDVAFTLEREKRFLFNDQPVLVSWSRLYVRQDRSDIRSITDLDNRTVAVLKGSVNYEGAGGIREIVQKFNIQCRFQTFDSYGKVFAAVADGRAHAGVSNRDFGNKNRQAYGLNNTAVIFQPISIRFAFSRQHPHTAGLVRRTNAHMNRLIHDDTSVYYQLLEKYVESEVAEKPVTVFPWQVKNLIKGAVLLLFCLLFVILVSRIEVKRKTRELQGREAHLRTLIKAIPDMVWLKDPNGVYIACNPRFERFFGAREKEITGKTDYDFVDRALADFFRKHDKAAMSANRPTMNEEEVTYADDGHRELLETVKTPMYDLDGQLVGVLGIARDITDRRRAQEEHQKLLGQLAQARKMEAMGQLAGGIAHDFNNILSGIFGYAQLAKINIRNTDKAEQEIDRLIKAAEKAADLVQQILTFSRKTTRQAEVLDLFEVVREVVSLLRATIPSSIEIRETAYTRSKVMADPGKIHQVIMNLCTNAYHAMLETGGVLGICIEETLVSEDEATPEWAIAPGRYVKLTISDTGHGMDEATREKIFEPYFTTKAPDKGTGMGLSVVYGIVEEHLGHIKVYSEPGQGSSFHVYLPVSDSGPDPETIVPVPKVQALDRDLADTGTETLLIVDDEAPVLETAKRLFQTLGYTVEAVHDPALALDRFRKAPDRYDLVITDMTMPGMDGLALSRKILSLVPDQPVLLWTGHSELIDREKARKAGIREYYEKPVQINSVARAVRRALDHNRPDRP